MRERERERERERGERNVVNKLNVTKYDEASYMLLVKTQVPK